MSLQKVLSSFCLSLLTLSAQARGFITCQGSANEQLEIASALYDIYTDPLYRNFTMNIAPCYTDNAHVPIVSLGSEQMPRCRRGGHGEISSICFEGEVNGNQRQSDVTSFKTPCKWNYVQDIEDARIPRVIAKAVCTCRDCHRGTCQNVYSYIPVLKKQCNEVTRVFRYQKYIYKVPVACVCVRSKPAGTTIDSWSGKKMSE